MAAPTRSPAARPGHETWSTTIEVAAEGGRAAVEVPRFKALRGPTNTTVVIDRQAASPWTRRRKVALGVAGAGALAVVAGAVLGLRAGSLDDQAHNTCPPAPEPCTDAQAARANQLADQARTRDDRRQRRLRRRRRGARRRRGVVADRWPPRGAPVGRGRDHAPTSTIAAPAWPATWSF
jgi:hypothetical protein